MLQLQKTPDDPGNEIDLRLLRDDPKALLVRHQNTIHIIVRRFVASSMFRPDELEEIVQQVNLEVLRRLPKMQSGYDGSSLVRTYFSVIVRNICFSISSRARTKPVPLELPLSHPAETPDPLSRLHVEHAVRLFRVVMRQFEGSKSYPKLIIGLKLRFRLPLSASDVLHWCPQCPDKELDRLIRSFGRDYAGAHDRDVWAEITEVSNQLFHKRNTPDAFRKWMEEHIAEILELLNGRPKTRHFDEETLKILVEDFFSPFLRQGE